MGFKIKPKSQIGNICTFPSSGNWCCSIVNSSLRCHHLTQGCSQSVYFWNGKDDRRNWVREESLLSTHHIPAHCHVRSQSQRPQPSPRELRVITPLSAEHLSSSPRTSVPHGVHIPWEIMAVAGSPSTQDTKTGRRIIILQFYCQPGLSCP